jgi:site-specific DNA-methyltransferase (adenine-specific)
MSVEQTQSKGQIPSVGSGRLLGVLPRPYYEDAHVTLYHGDCREILPLLGRFDLMLTDPPYGLKDKLQGGTWGKAYEGEYKDWDHSTVAELESLRQCADMQVIWGGNYYPLPPTRCWLIWNKPERGLTMADAEIAWVSRDGNIRVFDSSRNPDGKRDHPTQKPLELMTWCIAQFPHAKTIIDPFAGSGTTGRAAKDMGRKCVLIEREQKYCDVIVRRLAQEVLPFA